MVKRTTTNPDGTKYKTPRMSTRWSAKKPPPQMPMVVVSPSVTANTGKDDSTIDTAEGAKDSDDFRDSGSNAAKNIFGNNVININSDNKAYEHGNSCWDRTPDTSDEEDTSSKKEDAKLRHNKTVGGGAAVAAGTDAGDADTDAEADAAAAAAAIVPVAADAIVPVAAGDIPFAAAIVTTTPAGSYTLKTLFMSSSTAVQWRRTADDPRALNRCFAVSAKSGDAICWCMLPRENGRASGDCYKPKGVVEASSTIRGKQL
ncbi:MAG: hypothetical protein SGBAC_011221 [Bacillariaceae sp.]